MKKIVCGKNYHGVCHKARQILGDIPRKRSDPKPKIPKWKPYGGLVSKADMEKNHLRSLGVDPDKIKGSKRAKRSSKSESSTIHLNYSPSNNIPLKAKPAYNAPITKPMRQTNEWSETDREVIRKRNRFDLLVIHIQLTYRMFFSFITFILGSALLVYSLINIFKFNYILFHLLTLIAGYYITLIAHNFIIDTYNTYKYNKTSSL
jgi:hypothetical protein